MSFLTDNISDDSLVGRLFNGFVEIETAKVQQRLSGTDTQQLAYGLPASMSNPQAAAAGYTAGVSNAPSWGMLAALAVVAVGAVVLSR